MRVAALTKKYKSLNLKLKDANAQIKEWKLNEIKGREEKAKLQEELNQARVENSKLRTKRNSGGNYSSNNTTTTTTKTSTNTNNRRVKRGYKSSEGEGGMEE